MTKTYRVTGINFDHMHMPDLLRTAAAHPQVEIAGMYHTTREKMHDTARELNVPDERLYTNVEQCLDETQPDIVVMCPATAKHADYTERVAAHGDGYHIVVEKPFASTLAEADRMIAAVERTGKQLIINWPLAWYEPHRTTHRLISEGVIGDVIEVHYYDGNKGDGFTGEQAWFLKKEHGGGSLQDYLGYGATLGTWYQNNRIPEEVLTMTYTPDGWEVDNHSISIVRYAHGLSKMETRWGTLTSPWEHQPQPRCGFVVVGTEGSIASYDFNPTVHVQTADKPDGYDVPVDTFEPPYQNYIQYLIHSIETGTPITGPLSVKTARIGQQIVDAAVRSAEERRPVPLAK